MILRAGQAADVLARLRLRPIAARIATDAFGNALGTSLAQQNWNAFDGEQNVNQSAAQVNGWPSDQQAVLDRALANDRGPTVENAALLSALSPPAA